MFFRMRARVKRVAFTNAKTCAWHSGAVDEYICGTWISVSMLLLPNLVGVLRDVWANSSIFRIEVHKPFIQHSWIQVKVDSTLLVTDRPAAIVNRLKTETKQLDIYLKIAAPSWLCSYLFNVIPYQSRCLSIFLFMHVCFFVSDLPLSMSLPLYIFVCVYISPCLHAFCFTIL